MKDGVVFISVVGGNKFTCSHGIFSFRHLCIIFGSIARQIIYENMASLIDVRIISMWPVYVFLSYIFIIKF